MFLYPPKIAAECSGEDGEVLGDGSCGVNGNEKVFSADQQAADCDGNLAGPFVAYGMEMSTATTLMGDDTVLYQVRMPDGSLMQNQLTSLPGNDTRVRTAQGFYMGNPTYASYYRERRVTPGGVLRASRRSTPRLRHPRIRLLWFRLGRPTHGKKLRRTFRSHRGPCIRALSQNPSARFVPGASSQPARTSLWTISQYATESISRVPNLLTLRMGTD